MKKTLLFAAFAAAALVSCSKDQVVDVHKDEIKFSVVADNATKAADVYCNNNLLETFYIDAAHTYVDEKEGKQVNKFFENETVTYDANNNIWNPNITRYWPESGSLTFVANNIGKVNWVGYELDADLGSQLDQPFHVNEDVTKQVDFVYAISKNVTKPSTGSTVDLNFRHALSMLEFQIENNSAQLYVEATGVAVGNMPGYGKFCYPLESTTPNQQSHNGNAAPANVNRGTWISVENQGFKDYVQTYVVNFNKVAVKNGETKGLTLSTDAADNSRDFKNSMLVIPHMVSSDNPSIDVNFPWNGKGQYLSIKCKIYNVAVAEKYDSNNNLIAGTGYQAGKDVLLYEGWAKIKLTDYQWVPGMKYIYTFIFGQGNGGTNAGNGDKPGDEDGDVLYPITYNVTVDDFLNSAPESAIMKK